MDTPDPLKAWRGPPRRSSGVLTRRDVGRRDRVEDFRALRSALIRRYWWLAPVREVMDRYRALPDLENDAQVADASEGSIREDSWSEENLPPSTAAWTSLDPPPPETSCR